MWRIAVLSLVVSLLWPVAAWPLTMTANPDGTYTVTLTDAEKAVLTRAIQEHGPGVFKVVIVNWLTDRLQRQDEADRTDFLVRYKKLSPADQQTIKNLLNSVSP